MKYMNNMNKQSIFSLDMTDMTIGFGANGHRRRRATIIIGLSAGANNDLGDNGNSSFVGIGAGLAAS